MKTYDHIILGSGQATGTLLARLIPTGQSIAVVEESKVGGSCVNYGCTPTKTLVASAKAIHMAGKSEFYGFGTGKLELNYARIRERMNEIRHGSSDGLANWMEHTENVDLIKGHGSFVSDKILEVGGIQLEGNNIYINAGTRPRIPNIRGIEEVPWMDSAALLDLERIPEHLIIIGGGYIGVEFAQIYRRFGSDVTIIQHSDQLMPREDQDVSDAIRDILVEEGIEIVFGARAEQVHSGPDNLELTIKEADTSRKILGSHLLIATGRLPNSDRLGLENTAVKVNDRGYIAVDDYCRTGVNGVFALGDINGHGAFTHTSVNDAEIVLDYIFGGPRKLSDRNQVYALFTDPPLGRVGLTEKQALASGRKVLKATRPMSRISRAQGNGGD